jgi:hypothetical protein
MDEIYASSADHRWSAEALNGYDEKRYRVKAAHGKGTSIK